MTIKYVEKIYKEMKRDMVKLNKRELIKMYNTLYSTPIKAYHNKEYIMWGICKFFENIERAKMLKL